MINQEFVEYLLNEENANLKKVKVLQYRLMGLTYREIGTKLGFSGERARQIFSQYDRRSRHPRYRGKSWNSH